MNPDKITLGRFTVQGLRDGYFHLDGGAMFGVVPKTIWQKLFMPDNENRIRLGLNSLLIQDGGTIILVDTGAGDMLPDRFSRYYSFERANNLIGELSSHGIEPEDINIVINTHLHFDHCGFNMKKNPGGKLIPTFPKARYLIQQGEWEAAVSPCRRDKPSYIKELFLPLQDWGLLELIEGSREIIPGIEVILTPGHTAFHQCVKIKEKERTLVFFGDLIPTSSHVALSYIMSYDLFPQKTMDCKKHMLGFASDENWIAAFNHDPDLFFGSIFRKKDDFRFSPYI